MSKYIKIIFAFFLLFNIAYSKKVEKVTIQLQWLDQFQFAGFYIAKEKGFYDEVNLDVDILKYSHDLDVLNNVVNGKATYATGRTSLLIHKNNGYPVVALAAIFQNSPSALLVTNEKIKTLKDLIGKKIMISSDAVSSASYMSMLFSEGVKKEDLIIQKHSYNVDDLLTGKTDAIASYISNEPYKLEKKSVKYKYFHPKDFGFDFYGDILYTSKKELKENPKRVENFTKASLRGWKYAFDNIEETAKLIFDKYNSQGKTLDELVYEGYILKDLAHDEKNEIGHIDKEKLLDIARTYRLLGLIKKDYNLDDFLYEVHCHVNELDLNDKETKWLLEKKVLKIGWNKEWNPIEYYEDGQLKGIAAGYLEILRKKLNVKFELAPEGYWDSMIKKIQNKELDMFLAIVNTPKRQEYMNFTVPYLEFPTVILTKDSVPYVRNLDELSNKKVAVEKNFYTNELINIFNSKIELVLVNTTAEAIEKVYKEEVFAYIGALPNSTYFANKSKYTNIKINGEAPFKTKISFSSSKESEILDSILKKTLASITEKEHNEIYNKGINIKYQKEVINYKYLMMIILAIILISLILYIKNKTLSRELKMKEMFTSQLNDLNDSLKEKNVQLKELSEKDTLTGLANRRKIDSFLEIEIERAKRHKLPLSIIMADVDFFKKINDTYGHKVGDKVLIEISNLLKSNLRKYDLVGRWGGEEFIIICPNSQLNRTYKLSNKLKDLISQLKIESINNKQITLSFGMGQLKDSDTIDTLITKADEELYKAKENGRNCIYPIIS